MPSANINITDLDHEDFRGANHEQQRRMNDIKKWCRDRYFPCTECYDELVHEGADKKPLKTFMRGENMTKNWRPRLDRSNYNKLDRVTSWTKPCRRQHTTTDALREVKIANTMTSSYLVSTSTYTPPSRVVIPADDGSARLLHHQHHQHHHYDHSDLTDGPLRSLPLAAFIKKPTVRDTERLVNREYEIVDSDGSTATGRRARELLRQSAPSTIEPTTDDDFELI
ncbi:MAG: hypothetical protein STHCBS139747_003355 [Sporothrix thermara]